MAKFSVGHKLAKGRPKGSMNRRTADFIATLEERGFNAADALIDIHKIALEKFIEECKREDSNKISPMESRAPQYLKLAGDMAKEVASYSQPKLKAIERTTDDPLKDMTPEQKLEAMKEAVKFLEAQVGK